MRKFTKPMVMVSQCLTGDVTRYDGKRISCRFVRQLRPWAKLTPVCPEMEIGLGMPRDKIQLATADGDRVELHQLTTGRNLTRTMTVFSRRFVDEHSEECDGFILKSKSPSCGLGTTKLFDSPKGDATVVGKASGLFAEQVKKRLSHLAIEDDRRLDDPRIREHWLTKLFALAEFRNCRKVGSAKKLVWYHAYYRVLLQAYSAKYSDELEHVAAGVSPANIDDGWTTYRTSLAQVLQRPPRRKAMVRAFEPALEHYAPHLTPTDKRIFNRMRTQYISGNLPLSTIRKTVQIWAVRYDKRFIRQHSLYRPYPGELAIIERSRVR